MLLIQCYEIKKWLQIQLEMNAGGTAQKGENPEQRQLDELEYDAARRFIISSSSLQLSISN